MRVTQKMRRATAFHEAGHVVAAIALKRGVRRVTVVPNDEAQALGQFHGQKIADSIQPDVRIDARTRATLEAEVMVCLAGGITEWRFTGKKPKGCGTDLAKAVGLAEYLTGSPKETAAYVEWLRCRVDNLLATPWNMNAVRRLAGALLEQNTLSGAAARRIVRNEIEASREAVTVSVQPFAAEGTSGS